jgi:hypothetical protein
LSELHAVVETLLMNGCVRVEERLSRGEWSPVYVETLDIDLARQIAHEALGNTGEKGEQEGYWSVARLKTVLTDELRLIESWCGAAAPPGPARRGLC